MSPAENKQALFRCIELFNKCTLEWVDTCYSDKLEWIELPTPEHHMADKAILHFIVLLPDSG